MTQRQNVEFRSRGITCRAWFYSGEGDEFAGPEGKPCIAMAHGFAGTRDAGLTPFAEKFSAAGLNALIFDYRHFGDSDGEPRQLLSISKQLEDWAAAIAYARHKPDVDPARVALWGTSFSGGHVIAAAVRDGRVAAVTAQGPMMDGFAALNNVIHYAGMGQVLRMTSAGLRDAARAATGREPYRIAAVGRPGELAAMTAEDAYDGYTAITPDDWRNEFCARLGLTLGSYRPGLKTPKLGCPALIQVCERDSVAPAEAAIKAAERAADRVELKRYDIGHFDVYVGEGFEQASDDQIAFFRKHLRR